VIGGFIMSHGHVGVLIQPNEFIVIGGAAGGAFLISNPISVVKGSFAAVLGLLKPNPYNEKSYGELLKVLYDVFQKARKDGLVGLEAHIEDPHKSDIFKKYAFFSHHHHAMSFVCDTLKVLLTGTVENHNLAEILDMDLEKMHEEEHQIPGALSSVGDGLPGFGIVAAVLGVVITMGSIGGAASEIGEKVAAALVGTFLGILLSYGFIQPLSSNLEARVADEGFYCICIKSGLLALYNGSAPAIAIEFARRVLPHHVRPSFEETEKICRAATGRPEKVEAAA
jgi:chemotaxis protein MotA